jgi:hypothetical protein
MRGIVVLWAVRLPPGMRIRLTLHVCSKLSSAGLLLHAMNTHVFLSYAHEDEVAAKSIRRFFEDNNDVLV